VRSGCGPKPTCLVSHCTQQTTKATACTNSTWQRSSRPPSVPTTTSEASSCAVAAGQN
jgi:hypothetical protein